VRALVALIAVLTGLGIWFRLESDVLRSDSALANQALVDPNVTSQLTDEVDAGITEVFSYRYDNTAPTEQAARQVLAGNARGQYDSLFTQVRTQAPTQKLMVTTKVVASGVTTLQGDRARLLVFLDQLATRGDNGQSSVAAAELTVAAQRQGEHWVITDMATK
jgi:Mce-associated membrane protein